MKTSNRGSITTRLIVHMGVAVFVMVASTRLASGHAGDTDPTHIHACVGNNTKIVRDVGVNGACVAAPPAFAETARHWNIAGPAGPQGPQGPPGPAGTVQAYIANTNSHIIEGPLWQELVGLSDIPGGFYIVWMIVYVQGDDQELPVVCNLHINNDPNAPPADAVSGLPLTVFSGGNDGYGVIPVVRPQFLPNASNVIRVFCTGGSGHAILTGDMAALKIE